MVFETRKNFDGTNHYFWMHVVSSYDSLWYYSIKWI